VSPRSLIEDLAFLALAVLMVVLPALLGSTPGGDAIPGSREVPPARIDVNDAPWHEWMLLEGIGEVRARRIVEYREAHGPFKSLEDLRRVPGMPEGWLERAREHLAFGTEEADNTPRN
jgi:competence ComEA-like helix-hairpin-helix protein